MKLQRRYWWVNHKHGHPQEVEGEYLWSPKKNKNGTRNDSFDNMTRVMPGDVVFSFVDSAVGALGLAMGRAREMPKPAASAADKVSGTESGWQLPVRFVALRQPMIPGEHRTELAPLLPAKRAPIRANGEGNPGVYLAAVPETLAMAVRRLLEGQAEEAIEQIIQTTGGSLLGDVAEETIQQRTDLSPVKRSALLKSRHGQGLYRDNLEKIEQACRVTGLLDRRHLRAAHIKPWCECTDAEKLDGFNGLLLSPHIEHLFERGYISFSDTGELLISRYLNPLVVKSWGIAMPDNVGPFRPEQCAYLDYHRREVFEQQGGGRRGPSADSAGEEALLPHIEPAIVHPV